MTLIAESLPLLDQTVTVVPERTSDCQGQVRSPVRTVLFVMAVAVVVVLVSTSALIALIADVSPLAAAGFGAYCAFWLGGGFGLIFGSAAAFATED